MSTGSVPDGPPPAPLLAAATGDAAAAALLAAAGVDVVVAYHSSVLRRRGLPSVAGLLPWASANELTLKVLPGITAAVEGRPVFATVCANDALRPVAAMLDEVARLGARGVLNAPTVGLLTGPVRRALEEAGLGFRREVELMAAARERGLRAWGYAFTPEQAKDLVRAGAEAVVVHLGITGSGPAPPEAARRLRAVAGAARRADPGIGVLAHGGPITGPAAFTAVCRGDDLAVRPGFFGASVFEHAPDVALAARAWRAVLGPAHSRPAVRPRNTPTPSRREP